MCKYAVQKSSCAGDFKVNNHINKKIGMIKEVPVIQIRFRNQQQFGKFNVTPFHCLSMKGFVKTKISSKCSDSLVAKIHKH